MSSELSLESQATSERLHIHFDVPEHHLKLETFVATAQSAKRIIDALNAQCFEGELEYELIVLPPQAGSFLTEFAIWVVGGAGTVFAVNSLVNTLTVVKFIEGSTGKTPEEWAKQFGKKFAKFISNMRNSGQSDDPSPDETSEEETAQNEKKYAAKIITHMACVVLQRNNSQLQELGADTADLINACADFYSACIQDDKVAGVGFTPEHDFPIRRSSFPERAQRPPRQKKEKDEAQELPWFAAIETIHANSPNWDKDKQSKRGWMGTDSQQQECYFVIEDAEFWERVEQKKLRAQTPDRLEVQWAYQETAKKRKNCKVLRVLKYNGQKLAGPLDEAALRAILGSFGRNDPPQDNQLPGLFD